ncbi:prepilin-type N-terminal cleavage/methylation domain-containing protein [Heliobacterium gestii]|uniref:Prepilin-type N-terminal cleavage/methylation domain-containing protein n=1 Tax=Heliomicrobium gestii TaxID=2699 RepID=A0A845LF99_HELGE|nr:type II secretion system protein GspG [Heliomicrobium gestii]MBM7867899.1 general secretion pathway protein G [Heliomicrobium gestii]MZP43289.1 prepilin-type N-terminal cleavage/methylation domain-containing protein [Heliomicrobium gestii]
MAPRRIQKRQGGFTLLEVMMVLALIGLMTLLFVPRLSAAPEKAKISSALNDVRAVEMAVRHYFIDQGKLPAAVDLQYANLLDKDFASLSPGGSNIWKDPWGTPYLYEPKNLWTAPSTARMVSYGPDRLPGGDDLSATFAIVEGKVTVTLSGF